MPLDDPFDFGRFEGDTANGAIGTLVCDTPGECPVATAAAATAAAILVPELVIATSGDTVANVGSGGLDANIGND